MNSVLATLPCPLLNESENLFIERITDILSARILHRITEHLALVFEERGLDRKRIGIDKAYRILIECARENKPLPSFRGLAEQCGVSRHHLRSTEHLISLYENLRKDQTGETKVSSN